MFFKIPRFARLASLFGQGWVILLALGHSDVEVQAQDAARISVETRAIQTYPFSEPNPIPILARDARLYPYHRFEGYAHEPEMRDWTVVHLENEWIEVWVLPEVGGKVWGARVKESGHEFIYRNEVLKFRNIALRGPWTSGGIEFNLGVIGHTPATATPVDWTTRENDDGSVSVFVGTHDLPSRTRWRVEVRLPRDRAAFETRVLWHNPTPFEQPYYNWMTGAAFAKDDLVMTVPGSTYLEHPGGPNAWPTNPEGMRLSNYADNAFGGNKSYHVVGEHEDFFGGYFTGDGYGFGHWARYEEMPGQKIWFWALSRQGGIWEDLLTDTDGQYMEFQAGRLFVQYSPGGQINPISQVGFDPGATDRWVESWFPVEGLGGLTDASQEGAMHVTVDEGSVHVTAHAFRAMSDSVRITVDGVEAVAEPVHFSVLEPESWSVGSAATFGHTIAVPPGAHVRVEFPALGLLYDSDPDAQALGRPFSTPDEALPTVPVTARRIEAARELQQGRYLAEARELYDHVLADEPWNRDALLGAANLEARRGRWEVGLHHARKALQLDTYDPAANFAAGILYRGLGADRDATEAFGWAARSMAFRSVAYIELAELALKRRDIREATRYARLALDYDRASLSAWEVLAMAGRLGGDLGVVEEAIGQIRTLDPLSVFAHVEDFLTAASRIDSDGDAALELTRSLRSEFPAQELIEVGIRYVDTDQTDEATRVFSLARSHFDDPVAEAWDTVLRGESDSLADGTAVAFTFPFRVESLPILAAASETSGHWSWRYLLALNLWARDRGGEAVEELVAIGDEADYGPVYVSRALLGMALDESRVDVERDLRRGVDLGAAQPAMWAPLITYLQDEGRWSEALDATDDARRRFPTDFNFELLRAASLVELGRAVEAIEVLDSTRVLPSEHSATSHTLFAQAHTMAGVEALESGDPATALSHFSRATEWPEHLGLGRPFDVDERLQDFLMGVALEGEGDAVGAREALLRVHRASAGASGSDPATVRMDLLGAVAHWLTDPAGALGPRSELLAFGVGREGPMARVAAAVRRAAEEGVDVASAVLTAVEREEEPFQDVEGRLIRRALRFAAGVR